MKGVNVHLSTRQMVSMLSGLETTDRTTSDRFDQVDPLLSWVKPLFILWLIFLTLHIPQLSNLNLSVDNEMSATRLDPIVWLTQDRWGVYLFEKSLMPQPVVPFFPIAFYAFFGSAAYLLAVLLMTGRKPRMLEYLLFPLFIVHPCILFLEAFSANIASQGLGLLLAWVCALLYSRTATHSLPGAKTQRSRTQDLLLIAAASIFGCLSISIYQSNAALVLDCMLIVALGQAMRNRHVPINAVKVFGVIGLITLSSLLLYKLILEVMRVGFHSRQAPYIAGFYHPKELLNEPIRVISTTLIELVKNYGISPQVFSLSGECIGILMCASVLAVLLYILKEQSTLKWKVVSLMLWLGVLAAPFLLNLICNGSLPPRTLVAVPMSYWCFVFIGICVSERLVQRAGYILVLAAIMTSTYIGCTYEAAGQVKRALVPQIFFGIIQDVEKLVPDFRTKSENYSLIIYGTRGIAHIYPQRYQTQQTTSLDGYSPFRRLITIRLLGLAKCHPPSGDEIKSTRQNFQTMAIWPQADSIRVVGNTILVKIGPTEKGAEENLDTLEGESKAFNHSIFRR